MRNEWYFPDIEGDLSSRESGDAIPIARGRDFEFMGGMPIDDGTYVVDPDYAELLNIDYNDLVRFRR